MLNVTVAITFGPSAAHRVDQPYMDVLAGFSLGKSRETLSRFGGRMWSEIHRSTTLWGVLL